MSSRLSRFIGHLNALEATRKKVERLYSSGKLVRRDIERIYEGLYLDAITSFESTLETLFISYLTGSLSKRGVIPRVEVRSPTVARDMLLGGDRRFVDWLPYEKTENRAKAFFRGGRPFTDLDTNKKEVLKHVMKIRNAIAHQSAHAIGQFEKLLDEENLPLPPRERTPAGFLRSKIDPTTTRYQFYVAQIVEIIRFLS